MDIFVVHGFPGMVRAVEQASRALGLTIPQTLLLQAERVIEERLLACELLAIVTGVPKQ